ncbi:hypothetical protein ACFL1T_00640 [Chlamydiota bacterium]
MIGYFKNESATNEVIKDGWFYTGDIGFIDKDGFVFITGRLKNVIVTSRGKNISPEEIEEKLLRSPFIKESCVLGRKKEKYDGRIEEEVFAIIAPNSDYFSFLEQVSINGDSYSKDEIEAVITKEVKKVNQTLAEYKRIVHFELWEELPKTTTLKTRRKEVLRLLKEKEAK